MAKVSEDVAMDVLIEQIMRTHDLDREKAEQAVGTMLSVLATEGDGAKVEALFAAMPGAAQLAAANPARSGLIGTFGGTLVSAYTRLSGLGLSQDRIRAIGESVFTYAERCTDRQLVRDVVRSVKGLDPFV